MLHEEILKHEETLERFVLSSPHWRYEQNGLIFRTPDGISVFEIPDWVEVRGAIIDHHDWIKSTDDLLEAAYDAMVDQHLIWSQ